MKTFELEARTIIISFLRSIFVESLISNFRKAFQEKVSEKCSNNLFKPNLFDS
jgi:hypothetical protein